MKIIWTGMHRDAGARWKNDVPALTSKKGLLVPLLTGYFQPKTGIMGFKGS
jgi:hypothetical protein